MARKRRGNEIKTQQNRIVRRGVFVVVVRQWTTEIGLPARATTTINGFDFVVHLLKWRISHVCVCVCVCAYTHDAYIICTSDLFNSIQFVSVRVFQLRALHISLFATSIKSDPTGCSFPPYSYPRTRTRVLLLLQRTFRETNYAF